MHSTIVIINDTNFATIALAEGWQGNGSTNSPYVITGYEIDATGNTNGIYIGDANASFIISDCFVHGANSNGICLKTVINGTVENNTCSGNQYGIKLDGASSIELDGNNCSGNTNSGVYMIYSDNISVVGNAISDNSYCGSRIEYSPYNLISNNTCKRNQYGISISSSDYNTMANNSCSNNTNSGIQYSKSSGGALSGNDCSGNVYYGMNLDTLNSTTVTGNLCSFNNRGIAISSFSTTDLIYDNNFSHNFQYGLSMDSSSGDNSAWNNTFGFNNGSNHTYSNIHVQALDNGPSNHWNSSDGHGNYWSDWQYPDLDLDGVVDSPYNISGSSGARDFFPLTIPGFQFDTTPPITVAVPTGTEGENGWFISTVTLNLSATDSESSVDMIEYMMNGSGWLAYGAQLPFLSDGNFSVEYRSVDRAGNIEPTKIILIKIDRIAPSTSSRVNGSQVTLIADDDLSGIARTVYSIDDGSWRNYYAPFKVTDSGNHTIEFYSIDGAGNVGQVNSTWVDNGMSIFELISAYGLDIVIIIIVVVVIIAVINSRDKTEKIE